MTFLDDFRHAVLAGLSADQKSVPCRYLYDARGTELFVEITKLSSYYLTRAEKGIFADHAEDIGASLPSGLSIIELGSGTSEKTPTLLAGLDSPALYAPVDIDPSALEQSERLITTRFPGLGVTPIHADFTQHFSLPETFQAPFLGVFPGSTLGNFVYADAVLFLSQLRTILGDEAYLLLGTDMVKSETALLDAYDEPEGVTAAFMLNLLARINRELSGTFDLTEFRYTALWDTDLEAVRMYLESVRDQSVTVSGQSFDLRQGELLHLEDSHKYTRHKLEVMGQASGWHLTDGWSDTGDLYGVHLFKAAAPRSGM